MNKIYIGNYNINKAYLGGDLTIKIYLGDNLVYPIEDSVAATYYDESGNTQTILCSNLATAGYLNYSDAQSIGSGFTSVVIDNCVQVIEMGGIGGGSWSTITSVTCGDSVQATSTDFLPANTQIVVFGTGLTTVDRYSFELLHDLQSVTFNGTVPPSFHADWETDSNKTFIIYVPCNSIEAYRTALSGKTANLNDRLQCIPTVQNKWSLTFANGDVRSLECNASGDSFPRQIDNHDWTAPLTPFDATHAKSGVTSAVIGDCVAGILSDGFNGFTSLSSVTVNPNTMYAYGGYSGMTPDGCCAFYGCSALTEFPYSSVLESIGRDSFHGCSGLTDATIASSCTYIGDEAFFDCTGLEKVVMEGSTPPALGGDFVFWKIDSNAPSGVSQLDIDIEVPCDAVNTYKTAPRWSAYADRITCQAPPHDYSQDYFTIVAEDNITVNFTQSPISASTDNGTTWASLSNLSLNAGDKMILRGLEASNVVNGEHGMGAVEVSGGRYYVEGNILSLYYGDDFYNAGQSGGTIPQSAFKYLFWGQSGLTSAENLVLPSTTVPIDGYFEMFINCTSMTAAPEIPATNLSGWSCQRMFMGCSSLIKAPSVLYANYVSEESYLEMFKGCTSLATAPEIMATEVGKKGCQGMFYQCSNLTNVHDLSVTTFYDWQGCWYMFEDCTSLTTAPTLPAVTLGSDCYDSMFKGCTSLNYIKCLATDISATNCTGNWVSGVAATGTFVKDANTTWPTGNNGIPNGWTVQDAV